MLINIYPTYLSRGTRNAYFYFPPKFSHNMENQPNKLNIEGFDPETNGRSSHRWAKTEYAGMKPVKNLVTAD